MRIRDVTIEEIEAGKHWRLKDGTSSSIVDWEIEEGPMFRADETVVYSALAVMTTGEVRPLLLIREACSYEWWGDTCEYVDGAWRELGRDEGWNAEEYVADPLNIDPSFQGEYCHERQRAGFARWRNRLRSPG